MAFLVIQQDLQLLWRPVDCCGGHVGNSQVSLHIPFRLCAWKGGIPRGRGRVGQVFSMYFVSTVLCFAHVNITLLFPWIKLDNITW